MQSARLTVWEDQLQQRIASGSRSGVNWLVRCYSSVGSTMDLARELLSGVSPERPALVLASQQSSGRGRQGRSWLASKLGFYGTYVFALPKDRQLPGGLALAVGAVLHSNLSRYSPGIGLKWPNDLLALDGRKLSGTLIEMLNGTDYSFVLTGIGINLAGAPADLNGGVALQEISAEVPSPLEIASLLSPALYQAWLLFLDGGFASFREEWQKKALFLGRRFGVSTGSINVEGIFSGVDESGALLLETPEGMQSINAGHVYRIDE